MTVYVDDMWRYPMGRFGRMKMSHMAADTSEELLAMADRIGVARRWIQNEGDPRGEHFDIAKGKRALAVKFGAVPIPMREMAMWMTSRRPPGMCQHSPPCAPETCPQAHTAPRPQSDARNPELCHCGTNMEADGRYLVSCPVASWWPPQ